MRRGGENPYMKFMKEAWGVYVTLCNTLFVYSAFDSGTRIRHPSSPIAWRALVWAGFLPFNSSVLLSAWWAAELDQRAAEQAAAMITAGTNAAALEACEKE